MKDHLRSPAGRPIRVLHQPDSSTGLHWRQAITQLRCRATGSVLLLLQLLTRV